MQESISKMIDLLPPLPETIVELEKFRHLENQEPEQLLKIIVLLISQVLKVQITCNLLVAI